MILRVINTCPKRQVAIAIFRTYIVGTEYFNAR
jgi:hypothetical protein